MRNIITIIILSISFSLSYSQDTELIYLSGRDSENPEEWDFMVTDGMQANTWSKIQVPSNWELEGFGTYNYGHDENKGNEEGLYKHLFTIPENWNNKRIFIVFEGAMTDTEVKINNQSAGKIHQGGFYRFDYEITDLLKFQEENLLEVTVRKVSGNESINFAERKSDYWVFGGIYRPVYLKAVPKEYISWPAIDAKANGEISVDVHLDGIEKPGEIELSILQNNGKLLSEAFTASYDVGDTLVSLTNKVSGYHTWTAESPNLYDLSISLKNKDDIIHTIRERFGFRSIEVREGQGIFLNDKNIVLKGCDRHSFRPESGRALSRKQCYEDVMLLKEMNMNSVRMSHYPPDTYFLDLCDEYGLYVLDELAGWQKPTYDTPTGKRLVKQLVMRDVNHPSVLFWDNGNEGGWNTDIDNEFRKYDPQNRNVLHPWELFGGIDTDHYENYESTLSKLEGENIFMSTESLHGLYDGGLGAGLDDYWKAKWGKTLNGGSFLWVFADEGVIRTDKNGIIDTDGNHAPDGILGPFHEKEASFFTIKEIWSPIYIETNNSLALDSNINIPIENRYDFTNLNQCSFEWKLLSFPKPSSQSAKSHVLSIGNNQGPDIPARQMGHIKINLPSDYKKADALSLTAFDKYSNEIYTWSWKLKTNREIFQTYFHTNGAFPESEKKDSSFVVSSEEFSFSISSITGMLEKVMHGNSIIPFKNGPVFVPENNKPKFKKTKISLEEKEESIIIIAENHPDYDKLQWTIHPGGWLQLDYTFSYEGKVDYLGVSFDYPEDRVLDMKWLGKGPYRVWKNRLKGQTIGVWGNIYNNFQPGTAWDYPEFPGYFAKFGWMVLNTSDGPITIATNQENLFLRVYDQEDGDDPRHTSMIWPGGDISILHAIPAIGTKFKEASQYGPQSQKFKASGKYSGTLYLYFGLAN